MGKTIFITGANSGLGNRLARHFSKKGWNVVAAMRTPDNAKELKELPNVSIVQLDLVSKQSIENATQESIRVFGKIDAIVNNAGIGVYGPLELISDSDMENIYTVNVKGVANIIRSFIPHFRETGGGKFINISSVMGRSAALPLGSLYNMTKFAVEGLTEGLYVELNSLNISVHLVEPGGFASNFGNNIVFFSHGIVEGYKQLAKKVKSAIATSRIPGAVPDPDAIVACVYDLATGRKNAFRTVVGKDARQLLLLRRLVPDHFFFRILAKRFT